MKHYFVDRFSYEKGLLQELPPFLKFVALILILLVLIILPEKPLFYVPFILIFILLIFFSHIPFSYFLKRLFVIFPFLIIIFLLSLFSGKSCIAFLYSFLKSILSISAVFLFVMTTRMDNFLKTFKKIPYGFLIFLMFSFLYRYFFLLQDEFEKMKRAMLSKGKKLKFKDYLILSGNIFLRTYERSERVLKAMRSRGYGRI